MPGVGAFPTLAQLRAWQTEHLSQAPTRWGNTADTWEDSFDHVARQMDSPGGKPWEGAAADVAQQRARADSVNVRGAGDDLRSAAANARIAAEELALRKRQLLLVVGEAEAQGFEVTETLAVRDRYPSLIAGTARQAEAQALAADVSSKAALLVAADQGVANAITAAAAALEGLVFPESPAHEQSAIQAVNYGPMPASPAPEPRLPGDPTGVGTARTGGEIQRVVEKLPQGDRPWIREVRTPQDLENLWKWMRQNGVEAPNGGYGDSAKGSAVVLPDGTRVGQRFAAGSNGQPVLDLKFPDESNAKIHINPRGGFPEIPAPRPSVQSPRLPAAVEPPSVRGGGVPGGILGGAPSEDLLPQVIRPRHAGDPDLPVVGDGKPDNPEF